MFSGFQKENQEMKSDIQQLENKNKQTEDEIQLIKNENLLLKAKLNSKGKKLDEIKVQQNNFLE